MQKRNYNKIDVAMKMIAKYTNDLNKMLVYVGVSNIDEFYAHKDEILKKSFHKADDIISIDSSIKKLKASIG